MKKRYGVWPGGVLGLQFGVVVGPDQQTVVVVRDFCQKG